MNYSVVFPNTGNTQRAVTDFHDQVSNLIIKIFDIFIFSKRKLYNFDFYSVIITIAAEQNMMNFER